VNVVPAQAHEVGRERVGERDHVLNVHQRYERPVVNVAEQGDGEARERRRQRLQDDALPRHPHHFASSRG
jgi:hypothetical protein